MKNKLTGLNNQLFMALKINHKRSKIDNRQCANIMLEANKFFDGGEASESAAPDVLRITDRTDQKGTNKHFYLKEKLDFLAQNVKGISLVERSQYRIRADSRFRGVSSSTFFAIQHKNILKYGSIPSKFLYYLTKNLSHI